MLVGVLGGLVLLGLLWILVTGLVARSRLDSIRPELDRYRTALASGDTAGARRIGLDVQDRASSAHQLTSGPAWWVGSHLLGIGTPLRTVRNVALVLDHLSHEVLPQLPGLAGQLTDSHGGSGSAGRIDTAQLQAAAGRIARIHGLVRQSVVAVRDSPASWFGPVADGRAATLAKLDTAGAELAGVPRAVDTAVPMLGANRPQRYFIGFMNDAESRSIGGLPAAFAIVTIDRGRIRIEHIDSDDALTGVHADVDLGAEYDRLYGQDDPAGVIQNSDIGPSFPDAARIWAGMWEAKTGEHVDGAVAIDPTALGYLLRATGPTRLAGGITVSSQNVAGLIESREYALYPGGEREQKLRRKQFLDATAGAVATKLLTTRSLGKLAAPLHRAALEHRIVVWSAVAGRERAIVHAHLGGVLAPGRAPFSAFFVNNAAGSKLDYYLHRTMTYAPSGCGAQRTATASFTLDNDTPAYHLPAYVTYVAGGRPAGSAAGYNKVIVAYYATPGATIRSVDLDGQVQHLSPATEDSLSTVRMLITLPAHARRTFTVVTSEPPTTGPVQIVRQPLASDMNVRVSTPPCLAAAAVPTGPASTGSPWLGVLAGLVALVIVLLGAWKLTVAAGSDGSGSKGMRIRLDRWREQVGGRFGTAGRAVVALAAGIVGIVVVTAVITLLGKATKLAVVVRADRPVYRFYLERRATWLSEVMARITHIGEYQEMAAMALAAALVLGVGLVRFRVLTFVVLSALFIWPFITFGQFYDWVDLAALAVFLVLAAVRGAERGRWIACAVLMTVMPIEKHLQVAVNHVVHGTVPPLNEAYAPVGPYPSGGCTRIVLILGLVAFLFARELRSRRASVALAVAASAVAIVETFSRIYLGKHWFVDCLGGLLFGSALLVVFVAVLRFYLGPVAPVPRDPARETIAAR